MVMERIYDNPNHPHYGPVRRQWVILKGLGLGDIDGAYYAEWGINWDTHLVKLFDGGFTEVKALRRITHHSLDVAPLRYLCEDDPGQRLVGPFLTREADGSFTPTRLPKG